MTDDAESDSDSNSDRRQRRESRLVGSAKESKSVIILAVRRLDSSCLVSDGCALQIADCRSREIKNRTILWVA